MTRLVIICLALAATASEAQAFQLVCKKPNYENTLISAGGKVETKRWPGSPYDTYFDIDLTAKTMTSESGLTYIITVATSGRIEAYWGSALGDLGSSSTWAINRATGELVWHEEATQRGRVYKASESIFQCELAKQKF
jgi:hypothetical protein